MEFIIWEMKVYYVTQVLSKAYLFETVMHLHNIRSFNLSLHKCALVTGMFKCTSILKSSFWELHVHCGVQMFKYIITLSFYVGLQTMDEQML